jgi:hypothetical protein
LFLFPFPEEEEEEEEESLNHLLLVWEWVLEWKDLMKTLIKIK